MKKEKFWNRKKITGTALLFVLVLVGCGVVLVVHNNIVEQKQTQKNADYKSKVLKSDKEKQSISEKVLNKALDKAVKEPSFKNIQSAQVSMKSITNETILKQATESINELKNRLDLINRAKTSVTDYQEDALNDQKKEKAQQALSKLTDANDKTILLSLQNKIIESTKQADDVRDKNVTKKISFEEIKKGNYNSLSGTWKNELGNTLTVTGDQMIRSDTTKTFTLSSERSEYERGVLIINAANNSTSQPEDATYNTAIYLAPAGFSPNIAEKDKTDITKDRILLVRDGEVTNHFSSNYSVPSFYYRVSSIK